MADGSGGDGGSGRISRAAAILLFFGILSIQVVVPLSRLVSDSASRFGWQMFSTVEIRPTYGVRFADGRLDTLDIGAFVANPRSDVDLSAHLPPHLCRRVDGATAVVTWSGPEAPPREWACPRRG